MKAKVIALVGYFTDGKTVPGNPQMRPMGNLGTADVNWPGLVAKYGAPAR